MDKKFTFNILLNLKSVFFLSRCIFALVLQTPFNQLPIATISNCCSYYLYTCFCPWRFSNSKSQLVQVVWLHPCQVLFTLPGEKWVSLMTFWLWNEWSAITKFVFIVSIRVPNNKACVNRIWQERWIVNLLQMMVVEKWSIQVHMMSLDREVPSRYIYASSCLVGAYSSPSDFFFWDCLTAIMNTITVEGKGNNKKVDKEVGQCSLFIASVPWCN